MTAGGGLLPNGLGEVALGPNDKVATSDDSDNVAIWQSADGSESGYPGATVPNPSGSNAGGPVNLALSPNGKTLATGADDGSVRIWTVPSGLAADVPARTIPPPAPAPSAAPTVQALAFSPNGRELAVYHASGVVEVFDPATGGLIAGTQALTDHVGIGVALSFTPAANVLVAFSNGDVWSWNLTGNPSLLYHVAPISSLTNSPPTAAISPDGTTLAFAASDTVQLWDMQTGQPIGGPIAPADGPIYNLAFSPDGKTLATGGADGTVRLWNVGYLTPAGALAELCARIRPTMTAAAWTATGGQAGMSYQRACAAGG